MIASATEVLPSANSTERALMFLTLGRGVMLPRATWWTRVEETVGWLCVIRILGLNPLPKHEGSRRSSRSCQAQTHHLNGLPLCMLTMSSNRGAVRDRGKARARRET